MNKVGIFLRTYKGDAHFLPYCLKSIRDNARGFGQVRVVCPKSSESVIRPIVEKFGYDFKTCPEYLNDYRGQKVTKAMADTFLDADERDVTHILFTDTDTIFTRNFSPKSFCSKRTGKPLIIYRDYETLINEEPFLVHWQKTTSEIMGQEVKREYMRRQPFLYSITTLQKFRRFCIEKHSRTIEELVDTDAKLGKFGPDLPKERVSIYNAIGAFCDFYDPSGYEFIHQFEAGEYECVQLWSWGESKVFLETLRSEEAQVRINRLSEPQKEYFNALSRNSIEEIYRQL